MSDANNTVLGTHVTRSPAETHAWAAGLLPKLPPCSVLALHGELGSGKTCFVQGLARAMGIAQPIWSPTFTLINEYDARPLPLFHADLYRIHDAREAEQLGLEEYFDRGGITVIEWAERAAELLPPRTWHIFFKLGANEKERVITVQAESK
jgi:tRNA threonylcarbamoyladenosine biosynthesis protein TsaE